MRLYKVIEKEHNEVGMTNLYAVMEDSIKLFAKVQRWIKRKYNTHRSVLDNNVMDVRSIEREFPLSNRNFNQVDNKEHWIVTLVKKNGFYSVRFL